MAVMPTPLESNFLVLNVSPILALVVLLVVVGLVVENPCVTSTGGGSGRCLQRVFTRASDGKPLGVVDQQPLD